MTLPIQFSLVEARVLGCLMEKEKTTPEYYPLTLNALTNACNQKSSRDPVMELDQNAVIRALISLRDKGFVFERHEESSRVPKYAHRFENVLKAGDQERAVLCVLLLRGPQTPGEIKTRSERLASFESPAQVESILQTLANHADGAYVEKMARQPGQKESRYRELLTRREATAPPATTTAETATTMGTEKTAENLEARLAALEQRVLDLEQKIRGSEDERSGL